MSNARIFRFFKTSPEIICPAVMMYVWYPLSLRNVEYQSQQPCREQSSAVSTTRESHAPVPAHAKSAEIRKPPRLRAQPLQPRPTSLIQDRIQGAPCLRSRRLAPTRPDLMQTQERADQRRVGLSDGNHRVKPTICRLLPGANPDPESAATCPPRGGIGSVALRRIACCCMDIEIACSLS
jgi:hypothetical protein